LEIKLDPAEFAAREKLSVAQPGFGYGRELFGWMRRAAAPAEQGGGALFGDVA
jgi:phosphogluconate dehydratase